MKVLGIALLGGSYHTGHAVRLSNMLGEAPDDAETVLVVGTNDLVLPPHLVAKDAVIIECDPDFPPVDDFRNAVEKAEPDILIFDCLGEFRQLKEESARSMLVVALDALEVSGCVQLTVNAVLGDWDSGIENSRGGRLVLNGPEFLVLSPELIQARCERHFTEYAGLNVLVSLGGTDPSRSTLPILDALGKIECSGVGIAVRCLASHDHPDILAIERFIAEFGSVVEYGVRMPDLLGWADAAVTGGGITAFECACAGVPAFIIPSAPHEIRTAELLETQGCSVALKPGNTPAWYSERIGVILKDARILTAMSARGKEVVDGKGARRVWEHIERLISQA